MTQLTEAFRAMLIEYEAISQRAHNFLASKSDADRDRLIEGLVHVGVSLPSYAAIIRHAESAIPQEH